MSGVRDITTGRVITGVSGSPGSLRALRFAADLARMRDGLLVPVLAWVPPDGDLADLRFPSGYLREMWAARAAQRLSDAIDLALGGAPPSIALRTAVMRGQAARMLVTVANQPGDVLVVGAGGRGAVRRLMPGGVARSCLAYATCPVVVVPSSGLAKASRGMRGWALRYRALSPEAAALDAAGNR